MIKQLKDSNVTERNVIVGVRPEHISLTDKSDQSSLEATIRVSEMMGSEVHLHVVTPGEKNMIINIQTVDLNEEELEQLTGGKKIYFKWQPRLTHLFDKETETTLLPLIK
jgi:multiple sugar transport system ATP-binding protein